ncbi:hypothetical protein DXF85_23650 [Citrobacter pasteurii]|uniref:Uncharacterized protein n=1 Tax=Citrobacter pasteurii TaxID=1563222 RepID=A0A6N6JXW3_9ENTR|nr:hypothetical protein DXF85_23650 [Citrobacter pasteurii]
MNVAGEGLLVVVNCPMALSLSGLRATGEHNVGRIRHLCRHPAAQNYMRIPTARRLKQFIRLIAKVRSLISLALKWSSSGR